MIDTASFGKALYQLAAENGTDTAIYDELSTIRQVVREEPSYVTLLDTPAVSTDEKLTLIRQAFGSADQMVQNFLCLLCERHSMYQLERCIDAYDVCYDEAHNLLRATAITALPLSERQFAALQQKLSSVTGKEIVLENQIDPTLISGITLRYGGVQLDDSIKSRLDVLRRSLSATIV